ncbi:growth/differentiation factor 2-like [Poecilia formosa]|uniref:Growth differentiation factor 2 n=1 Tax=Poecilia formosa TaxID=48698 RepID=A0A096LRD0_POEFO|nr:PREDICTED: growth/differentiation factor 2-like [Poecilia formosa]XP_007560168.2 PREDICTED: growth/differentiation factor 2-like [Poecilia formosa]
MKISGTFLLQMCVTLVVSIASCTCKPLSNNSQSEDLERLRLELYEDVLEEEDKESQMEDFLESMKEGFLRQLNLSAVPQEDRKISPSQFMVELYNKYSSNRSAVPQFDVIRSFAVQDVMTIGPKSRFRLQFNVSIPSHEQIITAELQLFFFPDTGSNVTSQSFKAAVKVYEANGDNSTSSSRPLDSEDVSASQSTWATFDVTAAIRSGTESGRGATALDVAVDREACDRAEEGAGCLNMSASVGDDSAAALIIFSDDFNSRRRERQKELREMALHEEDPFLHTGADWDRSHRAPRETPRVRRPRRTKRKADGEYCRRTSLRVSFKDIGWNSWIVAPPEYDAFECRGVCSYPLTDESTPSRHAIIQTLLNLRDPKKANMACCVPIKLDPITVMYKENGRITIRYLYEEMKVAECGCR